MIRIIVLGDQTSAPVIQTSAGIGRAVSASRNQGGNGPPNRRAE